MKRLSVREAKWYTKWVLPWILLALAVRPAAAQQTANSFDTAVSSVLVWDHTKVADKISTALVPLGLALPCFTDRTVSCVRRQAVRAGVDVAIAESVKLLVHRTRPDDSDRKSFFSEHTTLACVGGLSSKRQVVGTLICATTAYLRVAAGKHWLTDVLTGATVGWLTTRMR